MEKADSFKSFEFAKKQIDKAYKDGKLDRQTARDVLEGARKNYRAEVYNKEVDREHRNKR
jgi:hypothetical protein